MIDQNISTDRYKLIPRTLVFIFHKNEILLIQHKTKNKFGFGKWNGVGGHIEKGEDPIKAALREVKEETGINLDNLKLRFIALIEDNDNLGICLFIFSAESSEKTVKESNEGKLNWFSIKDLEPEIVVDDLPYLIELLDTEPKENTVKFLNYSNDKNLGKLHIEVIN